MNPSLWFVVYGIFKLNHITYTTTLGSFMVWWKLATWNDNSWVWYHWATPVALGTCWFSARHILKNRGRFKYHKRHITAPRCVPFTYQSYKVVFFSLRHKCVPTQSAIKSVKVLHWLRLLDVAKEKKKQSSTWFNPWQQYCQLGQVLCRKPAKVI